MGKVFEEHELMLSGAKIPTPYCVQAYRQGYGDFIIEVDVNAFPRDLKQKYKYTSRLKKTPTLFPRVCNYTPIAGDNTKIKYMLAWNEGLFKDFCNGFFDFGEDKVREIIQSLSKPMIKDGKPAVGIYYKDLDKLTAIAVAFGKRFFDKTGFMPTRRKEFFVSLSSSTKRHAGESFFEKLEKSALFQLSAENIYLVLDRYFESGTNSAYNGYVPDRMYSLLYSFKKNDSSLLALKTKNVGNGVEK